jgi:hypothetical protein
MDINDIYKQYIYLLFIFNVVFSQQTANPIYRRALTKMATPCCADAWPFGFRNVVLVVDALPQTGHCCCGDSLLQQRITCVLCEMSISVDSKVLYGTQISNKHKFQQLVSAQRKMLPTTSRFWVDLFFSYLGYCFFWYSQKLRHFS